MQTRHLYFLALFTALLVVAGCQYEPTTTAVAGAAPPVPTAIGPIPGMAVQPATRLNPYEGDRIALAEGRRLFLRYNCYGCHGGHAGGGMGPSLRDEDWIYGSSDARVFSSIAEGRAHGMPTWGTRLPQEEIWKLVAYIKSMRTPLEPDAPEQK